MQKKISVKPESSLQWDISEEGITTFEFDFGLEDPQFSIEDPLYFNSLAQGLKVFSENVWPQFLDAKGIIYRGECDFGPFFTWSELQEKNFEEFRLSFAKLDEQHLKNLFYLHSFIYYFQLLAHKLPDEFPLQIVIENLPRVSKAKAYHLLSSERFEHFELLVKDLVKEPIGVCFPIDSLCSEEALNKIDALIEKKGKIRPVYEAKLTEEWDGLDELYVLEGYVSELGVRKLLGFEAAGGSIKYF